MKIRNHSPIVVCGPSGSGKSTLLKRLLAEQGESFQLTISHTTRQPRKGELDGREYHFVDAETMLDMIQQGQFIEHTNFSGNYYGTSKQAVREAIKMGKHLILEVDIDGVRALTSIKELKPILVFIKPPSKEQLHERLTKRGTECNETLRRRLKRADQELEFADSGFVRFDLVLVNDDLDEAYKKLKRFLSLY